MRVSENPYSRTFYAVYGPLVRLQSAFIELLLTMYQWQIFICTESLSLVFGQFTGEFEFLTSDSILLEYITLMCMEFRNIKQAKRPIARTSYPDCRQQL